VLVLLFVAGIAMVGATHQVAWLATSDRPLVDWDSGRPAAERALQRVEAAATSTGFEADATGRSVAALRSWLDRLEVETWLGAGPDGRVALIAAADLERKAVIVRGYGTQGDRYHQVSELLTDRETLPAVLRAVRSEGALAGIEPFRER